jgi:hypothetical protein
VNRTSGAPVGPDVLDVGGQPFLAAVELPGGDVPAASEPDVLIDPPAARLGIGEVDDQIAAGREEAPAPRHLQVLTDRESGAPHRELPATRFESFEHSLWVG